MCPFVTLSNKVFLQHLLQYIVSTLLMLFLVSLSSVYTSVPYIKCCSQMAETFVVLFLSIQWHSTGRDEFLPLLKRYLLLFYVEYPYYLFCSRKLWLTIFVFYRPLLCDQTISWPSKTIYRVLTIFISSPQKWNSSTKFLNILVAQSILN